MNEMNRIACFHSLHFASFIITTLSLLMNALHHFPHIILGIKDLLSLSYCFTKKATIENLQNRKNQ